MNNIYFGFVVILVLILISLSLYISFNTPLNVNTNNGCYFNGTSYITTPNVIIRNVSISANVYFISPGVIVSQGIKNNSHAEWYLGEGGEINNKLGFGIFSNMSNGNNLTFGWRFATTVISNKKWYKIVGVYNSKSVKLYINGNLVSVRLAPDMPIKGSKVIFVGRRTSTFYVNKSPSFEYFVGHIRNLKIFNRSLNQNEISELNSNRLNIKPFLTYC